MLSSLWRKSVEIRAIAPSLVFLNFEMLPRLPVSVYLFASYQGYRPLNRTEAAHANSPAQSGPMPSTEPPLDALERFVSTFFASFDNSVSFHFFYRPQVVTCMLAWPVYLLPLSLRIQSKLLLVYSRPFFASYMGSVQCNIRKNQ